MFNRNKLKTGAAILCATMLGLGGTSAFAQHGGGHFGGGGGGGHAFVGGGHAGYGYRGGYRGGYYGGYRGGYGYYRGGYYGGWGWGLGGLGLGLYFASLPLYYSTYWWGGVPYYYADNTYYRYDSDARQYETVAPPEGLAQQSTAPQSGSTDLIAYPKNGQSSEQQAKDKFECHHWAATQTGFDPTQGAPAAGSANKRTDYIRAQAACLDGRGYSVK
jgi:hypothetical protein